MNDSFLPELAVTGSTGFLGGMVARRLAAKGFPVRLLSRDPARAPELPRASAVTCAYANDRQAKEALDGVKTLFMVSASESADRLDQHRAFIDAAAQAGVEHIVYTSFYGAAPDAVFTLARDHWATERHIVASGMHYTFLRDNFYVDFLPALVGEDGVIRGPAGVGRVAAVCRADIAEAAAVVLTAPTEHRGATYDLTGPESLSLHEVAEILTIHSGSPVTFHNETIEEAYASRRRWDAPSWQYDAWVSTYTAIAAGELETLTDDVARLTGRAPMGLAEYLDN